MTRSRSAVRATTAGSGVAGAGAAAAAGAAGAVGVAGAGGRPPVAAAAVSAAGVTAAAGAVSGWGGRGRGDVRPPRGRAGAGPPLPRPESLPGPPGALSQWNGRAAVTASGNDRTHYLARRARRGRRGLCLGRHDRFRSSARAGIDDAQLDGFSVVDYHANLYSFPCASHVTSGATAGARCSSCAWRPTGGR